MAATTHLTTDEELRGLDQPDILRIHYDFLRTCEQCDSIITVGVAKAGKVASTLQLSLSQKGKIRVIAVATSTNFAKSIGPSCDTNWKLHPPPPPKPDFKRVAANLTDANWLPVRLKGEVGPITGHILSLYARRGLTDVGIADNWSSWLGDGRIDSTNIAMMPDIIPCMSDTMMRTGGLFDATRNGELSKQWGEKNPGQVAVIPNSTAQAMQAPFFNITATLDTEYKRRLPKEGIKWIFTRTATKMLKDGRMDADVTICNEDMELICYAQQTILVLPVERRFKPQKPKASL